MKSALGKVVIKTAAFLCVVSIVLYATAGIPAQHASTMWWLIGLGPYGAVAAGMLMVILCAFAAVMFTDDVWA